MAPCARGCQIRKLAAEAQRTAGTLGTARGAPAPQDAVVVVPQKKKDLQMRGGSSRAVIIRIDLCASASLRLCGKLTDIDQPRAHEGRRKEASAVIALHDRPSNVECAAMGTYIMHAKEHSPASKRNDTRSHCSCVALGNGELGGINEIFRALHGCQSLRHPLLYESLPRRAHHHGVPALGENIQTEQHRTRVLRSL